MQDDLAWYCLECGVDTFIIDEYYMLKDSVWGSIVPIESGMLCVGCVEKRLGRKLRASDFTDCPLNMEIKSGIRKGSGRLKNRLSRYARRDT